MRVLRLACVVSPAPVVLAVLDRLMFLDNYVAAAVSYIQDFSTKLFGLVNKLPKV